MSESQPQTSQTLNGYRLQPVRPDRAHAQPLLPLNRPPSQPSTDRRLLPCDPLPMVHADDGPSDEQIIPRTTHNTEPEPGLKDRTYDQLHQAIARGFRYTHFRANANTSELIDVAASLHAALEILREKGLLAPDDLERRKSATVERLAERFAQRGLGVSYQASEQDKYQLENEVVIDCDSRVHLCRAACCKLRFALSRQDVEEGLVKWDFANPYVIAQEPDHYCQHVDRQCLKCGVHAHRPMPCRTYDCRGDHRIWLDFEKRIVNPRIHEVDWPRSLSESPGNAVAASALLPTAHEAVFAEATPLHQPTEGGTFGAINRKIQRLASRPTLFQSGTWIITSWGVFLSLGFGLGILCWLYFITYRFQHRLPPLTPVLAAVLAVYAGSRVLFALEWGMANWLEQRANCTRGHWMYGGILGGLIAFSYYFRSDPGSLLFFLDSSAPAIALGYAFGKIGCLSYGCCIGRPTEAKLAVRYTAEFSKAVGYYELEGIRLIPVQMYETLLGLGLCVMLSSMPTTAFGQGQILGCFLLLLSLGRMILQRFRYHFSDEYASPIISWVLHGIMVVLGLLLLSKEVFRLLGPIAYDRVPAGSVSFLWPILVSVMVGALVFYLFGIYRIEIDKAEP